MDFDNNDIKWLYYEPKSTIKEIDEYCQKLSIAFFMRSKPAIDYLNNK